jgi:hypothetical protein
MSVGDVTISKQKLRELEICASLGVELLGVFANEKSDVVGLLLGMQEVLARYSTRITLMEAMK